MKRRGVLGFLGLAPIVAQAKPRPTLAGLDDKDHTQYLPPDGLKMGLRRDAEVRRLSGMNFYSSASPPLAPAIGEVYLNTATDKAYVYSGERWLLVES